MTVTRHSQAESRCAVAREMQCERDQCTLNRIECALPRSGFKPVRMRFDFWCSVNAPIELVNSISKDERGFPLTQYITNGRISRAE